MSELFSKEELSKRSFNGTAVGEECSRTNYTFRAVISQAELQFPGTTATEATQRHLRDAINSKCHESKK